MEGREGRGGGGGFKVVFGFLGTLLQSCVWVFGGTFVDFRGNLRVFEAPFGIFAGFFGLFECFRRSPCFCFFPLFFFLVVQWFMFF